MTATSRFGSMLGWDLRLQWKYGFYAVYVVVVTLFVLGLRQLGPDLRPTALALVVFGDPAFLGFYFVAALVLFEKREGVVDALTLSPLRPAEYLAAKALSLTALAVAAALVITVASVGLAFDLGYFLLGVVLTSLFFVLFGFVAVARFDTLNAYFMSSVVYLAPTALPLLDLFGVVESPLFYLIPTQASLVLLGAAFGVSTPATWELAYAVGYLLVCTGVAFVAARRAFERYIVRGETTGTSGTAVPRGTGVGVGVGGRSDRGPVATLAISDVKNWLRDPLLAFVAAIPVFYALVGRFLVPWLAEQLPAGVDLVAYYPLLVGLFLLISPIAFGFVTGFLVLEERDQRVLEALWTTPLTGRGYLLYRSVSVTLVSFVSMLLVAPLVGLVSVPLTLLVPVALVGSLWGVGSALLLAAYAENTVEGVAVSKFFGFTVLVPAVAIALDSGPWVYLAGVLPPFWPLQAFVLGLDGAATTTVAAHLLVGLVAHAAVVAVFVRRMRP